MSLWAPTRLSVWQNSFDAEKGRADDCLLLATVFGNCVLPLGNPPGTRTPTPNPPPTPPPAHKPPGGGMWEVGGGRWDVGGGRWEVGGGRWDEGGGRFGWKAGCWRWKLEGGRWEVRCGRWEVGGPSKHFLQQAISSCFGVAARVRLARGMTCLPEYVTRARHARITH